MPSLREIQTGFAAALLHQDDAVISPWLAARGVPGRDAINVYRNNVRETFIGALAACYPVLKRLVGDAYFRQMALSFRRIYPSTVGNIFYIGETLPRYLETEYAGTDYEYFADVARLEWACQQALGAPAAGTLDRVRLAAVGAASYSRLRFHLHPSVRLLSSAYPLLRIWSDNQPDVEPHTMIDLSEGGDLLLVRRDGDVAELRRLDDGEFAFLTAIQQAASLAESLKHARRADKDFDLVARLRRWAELEIIVDFTVDTD